MKTKLWAVAGLLMIAACGTTTGGTGAVVVAQDAVGDGQVDDDVLRPGDVTGLTQDAETPDGQTNDAGSLDGAVGDVGGTDLDVVPGDVPVGEDSGATDAGGDTATSDVPKGDAGGGDTTTDTGPSCSPALCDDKDPCTDDGCDPAGKCAHGPKAGCGSNPAPCNLAADCTSNVCDTAKHLCVGCLTTADCGNKGLCVAGQCQTAPSCVSDIQCKASGQVCNKVGGFCVDCLVGSDCAPTDTCVANHCVTPPPACQSSKDCAGLLVCDKTAGHCVACLTSDDCGSGLTCVAHACVAKVCTVPVCTGTAEAWNCNADGSGFAATPVSCADASLCTDDLCVPGQGCVQAPNSAPCSDGNACTDGDACAGGTCVPGGVATCDDKNTCTDDSCQPLQGCVHLPNAVTACDDGNFCTTGDLCTKGACVGTPTVNCDDGNACTLDTCDKSGCGHIAGTGPCDDGNPCSVGDTCAGKQCGAGQANSCDDGNQCTVDSCDPKTGCAHSVTPGCVPAYLPPCASDTDCTGGTHCDTGNHTCVACLASADCGTGKVCQNHACKASTACISDTQCKATNQVCEKTGKVCVDCNIADDCGVNQACVANVCVSAIPCVSAKQCPKTCDLAKGVCVDCKIDDDCTTGQYCGADQICHTDVCTGGVCNGGNLWTCAANGGSYVAPQSCDDGVLCTVDTCAAGGCSHVGKLDPGGAEFPGNALDDNCNGTTDEVATCDVGGLSSTTPASYATALDICAGGTSDFPVLAGAGARSIATGFGTAIVPTAGKSAVILSTGTVGSTTPGQGTDFKTTVANPFATGTCSATIAAQDLTELRLVLQVPSNATTLAFDWLVLSAEYPQWLGSAQYGDAFMALVSGKAWSGNAAIDGKGKCGTVQTVTFNDCTNCSGGTALLAGTAFETNGGSGWWTTTVPVLPGDTVTLTFLVYDGGDGSLDTDAIIDNVRWGGGAIQAPVTVGK